ncbi:transport and Golgi organization protein 6 [Culicoides brevitarsis]|uniref:transport and Golgi organization protein 6 n=1 Tax=Culicoides brevitarsis TaxID=469753 RepID=UPI00307B214D
MNIQKYFCCFEDLKLWTGNDKNVDSHEENLQKLRKTLPDDVHDTENSSTFTYASSLFESVIRIVTNFNLDTLDESKEQLISVNNFNLLIKIIQEAVYYGINPYLPEFFVLKMQISVPKSTKVESKLSEEVKLERLKHSTSALKIIFSAKRIQACSSLEISLIELLYCLFHLESKGISLLDKGAALKGIYANSMLLCHQLMLLKGLPGMPKDICLMLHKALLIQLMEKGGFEILARLLMTQAGGKKGSSEWQLYEIISNIVAFKGHKKDFHENMLCQVTDFLKSCVGVPDLKSFVPLCVTCLMKFASLNEELEKKVAEKLLLWLEKLIEPEETLAGTILMSETDFNDELLLLNSCFSKSTINVLPSKMLLPYYKVLFKLHFLLEDPQKSILTPILTNFINNRESSELKSIIKGILFDEDEQRKAPFDRISVKKSSEGVSLIICAQDEVPYVDIASNFSQFLISSKNMLLVNDVFIHLLEILGAEISINEKNPSKGDLLFEDDTEIGQLLSSKFMKRLVLIEVLQTLINCKQFQAHINNDPRKLLNFVKEMLSNEMKNVKKSTENQEITMLLLTIFKELLNCVRNKQIEAEMMKFLKEIERSAHSNPEITSHLSALFSDLGLEKKNSTESQYQAAMELLNSPEVYLKVYGIQNFIKLINEKDAEAIANKHILLVLALKNLKIEESYAYLNVIRLILALTNIMESEVIEALIAEFENNELDVDFRMKIGETTVKIAEALGPITYKYRKELVNCFLRGATSEKPELRASSLSNMGSICRILTYQVANFFQEILLIIHQTLQTETFLPARRSAVMILSDFLKGMQKLIDYQECLLPIYRTLKYVLQTETDEVTRIHAALSIETLNEKVKEMLVGEFFHPEIQINVKNVAEKKQIDVKYK